jgi:hypothetical protein
VTLLVSEANGCFYQIHEWLRALHNVASLRRKGPKKGPLPTVVNVAGAVRLLKRPWEDLEFVPVLFDSLG